MGRGGGLILIHKHEYGTDSEMISLALSNEAICTIKIKPKKTAEDTQKESFDPGPVIMHKGAILTENSDQKHNLALNPLPFGNCSTTWPQDILQHEKKKEKRKTELKCHPKKGVLEKCSGPFHRLFLLCVHVDLNPSKSSSTYSPPVSLFN